MNSANARGRTTRDFLHAAARVTGVPVTEIRDVSIRRSSKSKSPLVRRALILAMHAYFDVDAMAQSLGMKRVSITSTRYREQGDEETEALAKRIEADVFGKPMAPPPPAETTHPGYSKITASGVTIRRDPQTGAVLFHPHDAAAFQHLIGA